MKFFHRDEPTKKTTEKMLKSGKIPVYMPDSKRDFNYINVRVEDIVKAIELYKASEENK